MCLSTFSLLFWFQSLVNSLLYLIKFLVLKFYFGFNIGWLNPDMSIQLVWMSRSGVEPFKKSPDLGLANEYKLKSNQIFSSLAPPFIFTSTRAATGIEPGLRGVDMYNHLIFARDCGDRSQFLKESPRILEKHRTDDFFFRGSDCDFRFRGSDDF